MPYTLIKGEFHIHYPATPRNGPEPDGDTLKFRPDNRELIDNLPRPNWLPRFTQSGITTIRFEGIDTLETHFTVEGDEFHQNPALAFAARDHLLSQAGFGQVRFFNDLPHKVESVENHPIRGYILSNGLDTFGRTIAFVFTGEHPMVDGSGIFLAPATLDASLNAIMLRDGHAYAAFYLTLPAELREHLKTIATNASQSGIGLWGQATGTTTQRANIPGPVELQDLVIWPKLFRRLAAFYQDGHTNLTELDGWLRADPRNRDDRLLLPIAEIGNMHDLIDVQGNSLLLKHLPEDVVIVPDDYTLPEPVEEPDVTTHIGPGTIRIVGALINVAGPERGNETVTILNTTNADIDLSDWSIADASGQLALSGMITSGEARRVVLTSGVRLNNERDTITVLDQDDQIIDQVSYEPRDLPEEGYTMVF